MEKDSQRQVSPLEVLGDSEKNESQVRFPDGGWRAWSTVLGVWIVQFCTFGYINCFGVYQDFYVRIYLTKSSASQISWIGSIQVFLILAMGIFTGRAFDRGYYYHLMIGGIILFTGCLFMLSLSSPEHYYQVFLSDGLGVGVALGMTFVPSMSLISHYFQRRRTLALGIASSGTSIGGIVNSIMLNRLFHGSVGFQNGVRASAALNFCLLVAAVSLTRPRLPPRTPRGFFAELRTFARDPPYVAVVVAACLVILGLYIPMFFLQLDAIKHNISPNLAFFTITIMGCAGLVGRVLPNVLAHRYGVFNIVIPSTVLCGILIFAMLGVQNVAGTIAFSILYGLFSGGYMSLFPPLIATLTEDLNEIGARLGICISLTGVAGLIGSPIAGALLSDRYLWWRPIVFSAVSVILGGIALVVSRFLFEQREEAKIKQMTETGHGAEQVADIL